jgi:mannose-6-phosphate isomerase
MGTHPSGPATISDSGQLLREWLTRHPEAVGLVPSGYPSNDLPFLFKVLSVETALSIQAHPNKQLAQQLHAKDPFNYKDPNHKPEMLIALTPFECLCGFQMVSEILANAAMHLEFREVLNHRGT